MVLPCSPGVYEIVNLVNHKRYAGSAFSLRSRWKDHKRHLRKGTHSNSHLQHAWTKYGEAVFEFRILLICTREESRAHEQRLLDTKQYEYNIASSVVAPLLGRTLSANHRAKIGAKSRGRKHTPEAKARMSEAQLGKKRGPHSPEHRAAIGKANLGYQKALGYKHTTEGKEKISKALTGKEFTSEHCANISAALLGKKCPWVAESNRRRALANKLSQENQQ